MNPVEQRMAELTARFAARATEERAVLADALARGDRAAVQSMAHRLAGIAGMLGHPAITDAALALEAAAEQGGAFGDAAQALDRLLAAAAAPGAQET